MICTSYFCIMIFFNYNLFEIYFSLYDSDIIVILLLLQTNEIVDNEIYRIY